MLILLYEKKWLIGCLYIPYKNFISAQFKEIGIGIGIYSPSNDNFILLGDLNSELKEQFMKVFCLIYNYKNIVKENTCFKIPASTSCIDLQQTGHYTFKVVWFPENVLIYNETCL